MRQPSRLVGLDAARVLATFGIVWVHVSEIQGTSGGATALGRFGTSFYILAAVFFSVRTRFSHPNANLWQQVNRRARRLLLPYVIWCSVYAAFYLATMLPQGYPLHKITLHWGPFFGTAPHLWFLPFAFVAGVLASSTVMAIRRLPSSTLVVLGTTLTIGAYGLSYGILHPLVDHQQLVAYRALRLGRWIEEFPLVVGGIFGVTLYVRFLPALGRLGRPRRRLLAGGSFLAFVAVQAIYALVYQDLQPLFWTDLHFFANAAGALWLIGFIALRDTPTLRRLAPLGQSTYFAFLAHQLVIDLSKRGLSLLPGHGTLLFALMSSIAVFAASVSLGSLLKRYRTFRLLIP